MIDDEKAKAPQHRGYTEQINAIKIVLSENRKVKESKIVVSELIVMVVTNLR